MIKYAIIEAADGYHVVNEATYCTEIVTETKEEADDYVISNSYRLNGEFDNLVYLH